MTVTRVITALHQLQDVDMFSTPPVKKFSVVIPVYNEQESLPELIRRTDAACATLGGNMKFCWSTMAAAMIPRDADRGRQAKAAMWSPCCSTVTTASTRRLWRV
jgi:hypothetical protein